MYENYIYSKTHLIFEMQMKENLGSTDQSLSYANIQNEFNFIGL